MNHSPNLLLASLPSEVFAALQPHLKVVELPQGKVVGEPGGKVDTVYFPHSGIISLVVVLEVGDMIESAMVGKDGVVHAASAMDGKVSLNKAIVQLSGHASAIAPQVLTEIVLRYEEFRKIIIRHEQVLLAQAQQSAACNASHLVEARLCRWLLRCRDLAAGTNCK